MSSPRLTAGGRLERLLSIVPWVVANDGPTVTDIAERFDYPEDHLLSDLTEVLFMVGTYPYTPDQLVDVVVEDNRVWIHYAEYFARPLRLTAEQALALVTASAGLLSVPGADPSGPLARGLAKLAGTLGVEPGADLDVDLGSASADTLLAVREAIAANSHLRIDYYAYGRDETTDRVIEPHRLTNTEGQWYVLAYCTAALGERLFRLDRIRSIERLDSTFQAPIADLQTSVFEPRPDDPRVTLLLDESAAWVPETFPAEHIHHLPDGRLRVVLAISAVPWLERLLLRLGSAAVVETQTDAIPEHVAASAARRVLERYRA